MVRSPSEHLTSRQQLAYLFFGWSLFVSLLMVLAGHDIAKSLLASLMVGAQFTAGFVLFQVLTRWTEIGFVGSSALGAAFGSILSTLSGIALVSTPLSPYAWALPTVIAIALAGKLEPIERIPAGILMWLVAATLVGLSTEWTWLLPLALISVVVAAHRKVPIFLLAPAAMVLSVAQWWLLDHRSAYWSQFRQGLTEVADYSYLESIARGTAQWANTDNALMTGTRLGYHWLSYAWAGRITESVDATAMAFSSHVIQICFISLAVALTYEIAKRLGSEESWAIIASFTLVMVVGVPMGIYQALAPYSPSQPFVTALLFASFLVVHLSSTISLIRSTALLAVLAVGVVGGKVSAIPALLVGVGVFALIGWRQTRDISSVALLVVVGLVVVTGFIYFFGGVVTEGETGSFRFSFLDVAYTEGPLSQANRPFVLTVFGSVAMLCGFLPTIPGVIEMRQVATLRRSSLFWMLVFASSASFAFGLLYVGDSSGVSYFFNLGLALLIPVSSAALSKKKMSIGVKSLGAVIIVGFTVSFVVTNLLAKLGADGTRQSIAKCLLLLIPVFLVVANCFMGERRIDSFVTLTLLAFSLSSFFTWVPRYAWIQERHGTEYLAGKDSASGSPPVRQAAIWLREHSKKDDIIAVNRFCNSADGQLPDCPAYWTAVSSIVGRRMYLENVEWTARTASGVIGRALNVVRFVDEPSARSAEFLETANVAWVFVDKAVTTQRNWEPWAKVMFENDDAMVLRVSRQGMDQ